MVDKKQNQICISNLGELDFSTLEIVLLRVTKAGYAENLFSRKSGYVKIREHINYLFIIV